MLTNSGTINDQHESDPDSQNDHIRIIQLNIQSVRSKIADLRFDIQTNTLEFDILLISETWLKPTIPNRFLNIRDYKLIRSDRPTTSTQSQGYGGVGILMKTCIPHEVLDVQKTNIGSNLEILWVKTTPRPDLSLVIASVYRPPVYTVRQVDDDMDELEEQLQHVICNFKHAKIIIGGDFNACLLRLQTPAIKLISIMNTYGMNICNTTTPTYAPSNSLLDVVAINEDQNNITTKVSRCYYGTPHHFTIVNLKCEKTKIIVNTKTTRIYRNIHIQSCINLLRYTNWIPFYSNKSIEERYTYFVTVFTQFLNTYLPVKHVEIRNTHRRPLPNDIRMLYERRKYAIRHKMMNEYRRLNKECKTAIRTYSAAAITERMRRKPAHDLWRECQHILGKKKRTIETTHDANELNDYFLTIGTEISKKIPNNGSYMDNRLPRVNTGYLELTPIDMPALTSIVRKMKPDATEDADGISMKSIKVFYDGICHILLELVNQSLIKCEVPSRLKHAIIVPVPKGDKGTRPISILPPIMKIIEKAVQLQLIAFLEGHHILSASHHGYRKYHSCETALAEITDSIYAAMQERKATLVTSIDLSKCFDIVDHNLLLKKIRSNNIDERWFRSYLQDHTQQVRLQQPLGNKLSRIKPTTENLTIFQGGRLSCVLF